MKETRIIVCDDEKSEREELIRDIKEVWKDPLVEEAQSGREVLWKLEKDRNYDFIFLDIYMDEMDGIETGRRIHEEYPEIRLVFVSNSREFGPEAFALNAVHYLLKPYKKELLVEIRNRFSHADEGEIVFYDAVSRQELQVPSKRIVYIESARNYVYVKLTTGTELKVRKSLQEVEKELDERFLRISRGVIVNMDAVERMNYDSCEIDGVTFMLSRDKRLQYRKKYNDYIFSRYMEIPGGGMRMRGDIFWYILIQFSGYLIQILPLMFLFYVPCRQEMLRFSKKRILIALTVFFVISAAAASVFLGTQVWQGVNTAAVTWIANVFFLIDILAGTLIYYSSFRQKRGGKILFYTFVLEYGIALYILNEIGTRFINISEDVMSPYGASTLLIYTVCTGVTYPFIYSFLKKMDMKGIGQVDQKNLGMITVCSVIIVVLTVVALQMGVGLRSLNDSLEAKIYESVLVSCVLAANIIMYVIYFFCVALEHEREKMESRMIAYELQYENVREGIERKKRIQHNLRHHFRTLGALAAEGRNEEVQSYISSYMKDMDDFDLRKVSRNPVLDSVLSYYIQRAEEAKIKVNCDINVKEDYLFDIKDMTVLIGNAMENALKAAAGCRDDEAYINFMLKQYRQSILIKIENKVCPGRLVKRASNNKIEKSYGLASIEMIAEKYQGSVEAWQEEDLFTLRVVLNMPDDNRKGSDEG